MCRLARLASWAGLPQEEHVTPYRVSCELGRNLPEQRQAVDRIVGGLCRRALSARGQPDAAVFEEDWRLLRRPLLKTHAVADRRFSTAGTRTDKRRH